MVLGYTKWLLLTFSVRFVVTECACVRAVGSSEVVFTFQQRTIFFIVILVVNIFYFKEILLVFVFYTLGIILFIIVFLEAVCV